MARRYNSAPRARDPSRRRRADPLEAQSEPYRTPGTAAASQPKVVLADDRLRSGNRSIGRGCSIPMSVPIASTLPTVAATGEAVDTDELAVELAGTTNSDDITVLLRSKSESPVVAARRDALHKIGVTGRSNVSARFSRRRTIRLSCSPTWKLSPPTLYNINRVKLENLIHRVFDPARRGDDLDVLQGEARITRVFEQETRTSRRRSVERTSRTRASCRGSSLQCLPGSTPHSG